MKGENQRISIIMTPSIAELETVGDGVSINKSNHGSSERPAAVEIAAMGRAKDGRELKLRVQPKFENPADERLYRKQHLAAAFRVFADRGFDEGIAGHISVRDPILTDHFCECVKRLCCPSILMTQPWD